MHRRASSGARCGSVLATAREKEPIIGRKKVLVLGATGGTGRQVVSQALQQGHEVPALSRSPQRLPISHDDLRVLTGSVTDDVQVLAAAAGGQDVVISTLGVGNCIRWVNTLSFAGSPTFLAPTSRTSSLLR